MDMSIVGNVMHQQTKIDTLEKVNISLLKTNNEQTEKQVKQLLDSVAVAPASPIGNTGKNINIQV